MSDIGAVEVLGGSCRAHVQYDSDIGKRQHICGPYRLERGLAEEDLSEMRAVGVAAEGSPAPAALTLRAAARCAQAGSRSKKPRISDAIMEFQCAGDPDHRAGLRSRARSRFVLVVQTSSFQEERARALRSEDVLSGLAVEGQAVGLASIRSCILEAQRVQNYTPELGHCNLW